MEASSQVKNENGSGRGNGDGNGDGDGNLWGGEGEQEFI